MTKSDLHWMGNPPGKQEYYTPPWVFEGLRTRFGLDVASPGADIVPWIPADHHITASEDGLVTDWGNAYVWCNPPYSTAAQWAAKMKQHNNGILLLLARALSNLWMQDHAGDAIFFFRGRIRFLTPDGPGKTSHMPHMMISYGPRATSDLLGADLAGWVVETRKVNL